MFLHFAFFPDGAKAAQGANGEDALVRAMAEHLACFPLEILDFQRGKSLVSVKELCLASIYHPTGGRPMWVTVEGADERGRAIFTHLKNAAREGLDPEEYGAGMLVSLWGSRKPEDLVRMDTQLTYGLVKYMHDLRYGQLKLRASDPALFAEVGNEDFDPLAAVRQARSAPDMGAFLDALAPRHGAYRRLRTALSHYRALAENVEWPAIAAGPLIRPGAVDSRLTAIQHRLALTDEAEYPGKTVAAYHDGLVAAVKRFQTRHGLSPDGVIGARTLSMMNRSGKSLVNTIRINMARWHTTAHELGDTYLMVNIAAFSLKAVRNRETVLDMPVIVGESQHQTPIFSEHIRYLDFNPYWNVPPSIARNEDLPGLRKDPRHLVKRHIRLFSGWHEDAVELDSTKIDWRRVTASRMSGYKLRQDPGPWNALGRVKFVFPNRHSVYLHDTPTQNLFGQASRTFSHGCIRVSRPLVLAQFCLEGQNGWDEKAIQKVVSSGQRKIVNLRHPIPVHITYQTAWVDKEAVIHFNEDVYGHDAKLLQTLSVK